MLGPKFRFPGTFVRPGALGSANLESVSQPSLACEAHQPFPAGWPVRSRARSKASRSDQEPADQYQPQAADAPPGQQPKHTDGADPGAEYLPGPGCSPARALTVARSLPEQSAQDPAAGQRRAREQVEDGQARRRARDGDPHIGPCGRRFPFSSAIPDLLAAISRSGT